MKSSSSKLDGSRSCRPKTRRPGENPARPTRRLSSANVKSINSLTSASVVGASRLHAFSNDILNRAPSGSVDGSSVRCYGSRLEGQFQARDSKVSLRTGFNSVCFPARRQSSSSGSGGDVAEVFKVLSQYRIQQRLRSRSLTFQLAEVFQIFSRARVPLLPHRVVCVTMQMRLLQGVFRTFPRSKKSAKLGLGVGTAPRVEPIHAASL